MFSFEEKPYSDGEPYAFGLTLDHILQAGLRFAPSQEIVYRDGTRIDYLTLGQRINQLASALTTLGVRKGDTVAVMDWDSHRYLECFFAIPMLGATLHTINVRLSTEQLIYTMNHAEDKVVLANADFLPLLETINSRLRNVQRYVLLEDAGLSPNSLLATGIEYEDMLQKASSEFDFPVLDENTRATIFYTTGTTGLPKGVHFSHRQLVLHTLVQSTFFAAQASPGRFISDDVYMPLTPMFHVHAWGMPYYATMIGAKQVYPGKYEPEILARLIADERVTFSHCVPTILHTLLNHPASESVDLSHWKVLVGGAALSKGLAQAARRRGIEVFAGYGMSETGPVISVANLKPRMLEWDTERRLDAQITAGLPIPLVEAKTVDEMGKDIPLNSDSSGELVLRAPWLTTDYHHAPERSGELWRKGWMHTGDVARIDGEGYIHITDRIKDMIKSGGEWISSLVIEDMISQVDGVIEVAVIAIPDEKWGERPAAFVVRASNAHPTLTAETIRTHLMVQIKEGRLSKWAMPDHVEFVESIPKTSVGKIAKRGLRARFAE